MNETRQRRPRDADLEYAQRTRAQLGAGRLRSPAQLPDGFAYQMPWQSTRQLRKARAGNRQDWQFNGVFAAFSGNPFTMIASGTSLNTPATSKNSPIWSATTTSPARSARPARGSTRRAFAQPTGVRFGNTGRNQFYGPGGWNLDLSVFRSFAMGGTQRPRVPDRGRQHLQHGRCSPIRRGDVTSGTFGQITSIAGGGALTNSAYTRAGGRARAQVYLLALITDCGSRMRIDGNVRIAILDPQLRDDQRSLPFHLRARAPHSLLAIASKARRRRRRLQLRHYLTSPLIPFQRRHANCWPARTRMPLRVPTTPRRLARSARLLHAWEQWDAAHEAYTRAQSLAPRTFDWPYLDAIVLQRLARHTDAAARLEQALTIIARTTCRRGSSSPRHCSKPANLEREPGAVRGLCAALRNGARGRARTGAHCGGARASRGSDRASPARRGAVSRMGRRALRAGPLVSCARASRRRAARARAARADTVRAGRRSPDPVLAAVTSLRDDAQANLQRGLKLADAGDVAGAIAAHEAALALDPSIAQAHANLVVLYGRARNWPKAEAHYRAVVALGFNLADAHYDYGVLLGLQQTWETRPTPIERRLPSTRCTRRRTTTSARSSSGSGRSTPRPPRIARRWTRSPRSGWRASTSDGC